MITDADTSKDAENGIVKLALIERHKNTGHIGKGFLSGYGLKSGAVASSIGHDSHNLIVAGTNEEEFPCLCYTQNMFDWAEFIRRTPEEYEKWI